MKTMFVRAALAGAMLLSGAAVATPAALAAEPQAEENAKEDAAKIKLPVPPAGKGQIVFYRKGGLSGSAVACSVFENGTKVSSLGGGRYFVAVTTPGRHEFTVKTESKDTLALEVEPDETKFATCKIKMGIMVGRPDISPTTEADFRAIGKLRLVDADDMGEGALRPDQIKAALAATPAATPAP